MTLDELRDIIQAIKAKHPRCTVEDVQAALKDRGLPVPTKPIIQSWLRK